MEKFQLKIDVEPDDIPALDDAHKQDCAAALTGAINSTFKYTLIFSVVIAAFFAAYSFFSLTYMLRMNTVLTALPFTMLICAILIAVFEFISGTMKRWALILEVILHAAFIVSALTQILTILAVPFAFYGLILHIKLLTLLPHYDVISQLKGFPDFTSLPIGDVIKKADPAEGESKAPEAPESDENPENPVKEDKTEPAEAEISPDEEKVQPQENKDIHEEEKESPLDSDDPQKEDTDRSQKAEDFPKEEKSQPQNPGHSSKKNKKKKRKKSSK